MKTQSLSFYLNEAVRILSAPAANRQAAALLAAGILLVVAVLGLLFYLLFAPRRKTVRKIVRYWVPEGMEPPAELVEPEPEEPAEKSPSVYQKLPKPARFLLGPVLMWLLLLGSLVASYVVSSTDDVCARTCHATHRSVRVAVDVGHASCAGCHDAPLPGGLPGNVSDRIRMVSAQVAGNAAGVRGVVSARSCSACHRGELSGVRTVRKIGVRMKHDEPLTAGMTCTECHGATGHSAKRIPVSMDRCLGCHDGRTASAECSACHLESRTDDPSEAGKLFSYPPVMVSDTGCEGCHAVERECDSCHGVRMPHPKRFLEGYHAKQAAWEKKTMCWRCHEENECSKCHLVPFDESHAPGWKADHVRSPRDAGCLCHSRAKGRELEPGEMCRYCHDS